MNKFIFSLIFITACSSTFAQNFGGYLGKRFSIGLDLDPSTQGLAKSMYRSFLLHKGKLFESSRLNTRLGINVDYAYSKSSTVSFCISKFNDNITTKFFLPIGYPAPSFEGVNQLKSTMIGFKYNIFLAKGYPAPVGSYINFGIYLVHTKVVDKDKLIYGEDGLFSQNGYLVQDPEFYQVHGLISVGVGKRIILAKDRFLLDYGVSLGLYTGASSLNRYWSEYSNDTNMRGAINRQLSGRLATNLRLGISYLLF